MAFEFCALEPAWGNWADWASVLVAGIALLISAFVGLLTAAGSIGVAILAYRTSHRATQIADEAKEIAGQQHVEAVALRSGTARILGSFLQAEVGLLPAKISAVLHNYNDAANFSSGAIISEQLFDQTMADLRTSYLPSAEGVLSQLHTMPGSLGENLAGLIGLMRDLADTAFRIERRAVRMPDIDGKLKLVGYKGGRNDLSNLRGMLRSVLIVSIDVAEEFNAFTGADPGDYEEERRTVAESR